MKGRKRIAFVALASLLFAFVCGPAAAEDERPTAELTVSVLSAYVSKGDELSRNSVVIQPQTTLGYRGVTVNLWGNLDTRPYLSQDAGLDKRQNWTETDVTLAYTAKFGLVNAGVSYAYFGNSSQYSGEPDFRDDQEVGVTVGLDTVLEPTLSVFRSFDATQRWYFQFGISHAFALTKTASLKLAASVSYLLSADDNRVKITDNGIPCDGKALPMERYSNFHDGVLTASLPVKLGTHWTVTPMLSYVVPLSGDAKNDMKYRSLQYYGGWGPTTNFADVQSSFLVGGLSVSFGF